MLNKKGFTLVELLALMVILGVIATITIPNTIKLLDENKRSTFLQDATKLISHAEYTLHASRNVKIPTGANEITVMNLKYLNTNELEMSPYGMEYNAKQSFVVIINKTGKIVNERYVPGGLEYYAVLVACHKEVDSSGTSQDFCDPKDKNHYSIVLKSKKELLQSNARKDIKVGDNIALSLIANDLNTPVASTHIRKMLNEKYKQEIYSDTVIINGYLK